MTRIQIIDDDHWSSEAIIATLMDIEDSITFDLKYIPEHDDGRDIYIVDNEFPDGDHGCELVRTIRARNPRATIIMCSATDQRVSPREVLNDGCNAMIHKGSAAERARLIEMIRSECKARSRTGADRSLAGVLRDVKSILSIWNHRMDQEDRRSGSQPTP